LTTVTQAVEMLVRRTVDLSEADMGREWKWGAYDEEGLRFALLVTHHELRDLAVRLAAARERQPTQAQRVLTQYHQAYRDMSAALAASRNEDLDRAPAQGEWPLREVCVHMLGAEYGFLRVCRIALERHRAGKADEPAEAEWDGASVPFIQAREAATKSLGSGTVEQIRDAFATIHIRNLRELGDISDAELGLPSWFWDGPMPIRFRLHRFEEHLRQHTIQLDKTLAGIGRPPTEAHRLVRNIYNALADVESEAASAEQLRNPVANTIAVRVPTISAALA
jgi:uncharacterized damage-inducible protein DinB